MDYPNQSVMLRSLLSYFLPTPTVQKDQIKVNSHEKGYQPDCLYKIDIAEFNVDQLKLLLTSLPYELKLQNSMDQVIQYYQDHRTEYLVDQMDWLVFYRNRVPLLEIRIINAYKVRKEKQGENFKEGRVYELMANLD